MCRNRVWQCGSMWIMFYKLYFRNGVFLCYMCWCKLCVCLEDVCQSRAWQCGSLWIMFYKLYRLLGVCVFLCCMCLCKMCVCLEDVLVCVPKQGVAVRQLVNTLWGGCRSRTCPATIGRGIALDTGNKKVPFLEIIHFGFYFFRDSPWHSNFNLMNL